MNDHIDLVIGTEIELQCWKVNPLCEIVADGSPLLGHLIWGTKRENERS